MAPKRMSPMAAAQAVAAILFVVVWVSACEGASPPATNTAPPSPSSSPTSPALTPSRTLTPTLTPRYSLTSTRTPFPTYDETQRVGATAAQETAFAQQTQVLPVTETAVASFPVRCPVYDPPAPDHGFTVSPQTHELLISPDGNWLAQDCWGQEWSYRDQFYLLISNRSGSQSVRVPYQAIFDVSEFSWTDLRYLPILFWSPDNQSLYFSRFICCVDTWGTQSGLDMSVYPLPLYRVNVQTGVWAQVLDRAQYFSLSPTGRRLAYATSRHSWPPEKYVTWMNILDLQTGAVTSVEHKNAPAAGHLLWSADGFKMYYSVFNGPASTDYTPPPRDYQIFEVDTVSGDQTLLKTYLKVNVVPYPAGFTADGNLILHLEYVWSRDFDLRRYNTEVLDLTTGQSMTLTPTP